MARRAGLAFGLLVLATQLALPASGQDRERIRELLEEQVVASAGRGLDRTGIPDDPREREALLEITRVLERQKVTVNFDGTPLTDVLDFLADVTGLNIVLTRKAREQAGEAEVKLRLRQVKVRSCLELLLGLADEELRYGVRNGVLTIGLADEWKQEMVLRIIPLGELGHDPPDFPGPVMGLDGTIQRSVGPFGGWLRCD